MCSFASSCSEPLKVLSRSSLRDHPFNSKGVSWLIVGLKVDRTLVNSIPQGLDYRKASFLSEALIPSFQKDTSYKSFEWQYAVLSLLNTSYCLEERIRRLDSKINLLCAYGVLVKSDMPYRELIITHYVSATPEREGGDYTDSVSGPNLHTIGALQRSFRSQYDNCYYRYLTVDLLRFKGNLLNPLVFCDSSFSGGTDPTLGVTNGSHLDDGLVYREMVDEFAPLTARQMSLSAKVRMRAEYNVKETRRLKSVVERQDELLKVREGEIENLKTQLLLREAEATEAIRLRAEAYKFEAVEKSLQDEMNALKERNANLEKERNALDVKVTKLEASAAGKERELADLNALVTSIKSENDNLVDRMALHLEENFYPHLLTTISGRRWLLTHDMELAIVKCLNLPEYPSTLGTTIGKAIKKGMQDGLVAGITHGKKGRVLMDVVAHNPSAEVDYVSALQQLQHLNFPLLTELKSNKDASVETVMDILHLEDPVAEKLGLNELQPNVNQLMVLIHSSPDRVVIGATALSLALDVSSSRPFLAAVLMSTKGTSNIVSATINTTTTLSMTFASTGLVIPIFVDDYEVIVVEEEGNTWMTPIFEYLTEKTLSADVKKARAVRRKSQWIVVLINGTLYKKSFLGPWLWCVGPLQANYILREIHEGSCSMHTGTRSVVDKALRIDYYWPTMHKDARELKERTKIIKFINLF
ncbi:hypothetical protein Tco_0635860 [Tanacetum coccineum]